MGIGSIHYVIVPALIPCLKIDSEPVYVPL